MDGVMPKTIKIVSWNLGYWQYRKHHANAWQYLRDVVKPDIGLLQEVSVPEMDKDECVIFRKVHQDWGTAIYCRGAIGIREITMQRYSERVAAAEVALESEKSLFIASIHAPIINGRVFPHMDNIFTDIESA